MRRWIRFMRGASTVMRMVLVGFAGWVNGGMQERSRDRWEAREEARERFGDAVGERPGEAAGESCVGDDGCSESIVNDVDEVVAATSGDIYDEIEAL
jgi:hypothetical protein